jgi:hypothetical protein
MPWCRLLSREGRKRSRAEMGKRSGVLEHEADFMRGSLAELDQEISRLHLRRQVPTNTRNRKSLESRIHWLEKLRDRHPGINSN